VCCGALHLEVAELGFAQFGVEGAVRILAAPPSVRMVSVEYNV